MNRSSSLNYSTVCGNSRGHQSRCTCRSTPRLTNKLQRKKFAGTNNFSKAKFSHPTHYDVILFLICFPMKYWDFSVKSRSKLPLVVTSEITIFIFTVSKNGLFINFGLKVLPKGLRCSILVWNYGDDVNVPRWNRWRHLLRWRNAFSARASGGLSLTAAFSLRRFLAFYCF